MVDQSEDSVTPDQTAWFYMRVWSYTAHNYATSNTLYVIYHSTGSGTPDQTARIRTLIGSNSVRIYSLEDSRNPWQDIDAFDHASL